MKGRVFRYVVPSVSEAYFPAIARGKGAVISCDVLPDNEVEIVGNRAGLIYLAKYLAAMALLEKHDGFHVHLDPESDRLEPGSAMLTISNIDFGGDWGDRFKDSKKGKGRG
jgi:hypothetical protein